jgi:host factor-I protein
LKSEARPAVDGARRDLFWNESFESKEIGTMESKPAQNIQDTFLNTVRKDKNSVLLENNSQEQLIFKHAISTVVSGRAGVHPDPRPEGKLVGAHPAAAGMTTHETLGSQGH